VWWKYVGLAQRGFGKLDEAVLAVERASLLDPLDHELRALLGSIFLELGDDARALDSYRAGACLEPGNAEFLVGSALLFYQAGRLGESAYLCGRALSCALNSIQGLFLRATLNQYTGDYPRALDDANKVIALEPSHFPSLSLAGQSIWRLDDPSLAAQWLARASTVKVDAAEVWLHLGVISFEQGQTDSVIPLLEKSVILEPFSTDALNNLGVIRRKIGRLADALPCANRALVLDAANVNACVTRSLIAMDLEKFDEALSFVDRALAISVGNPTCLNVRGSVLWARGCRVEAMSWFDHAVDVDRRYTEAYHNRGKARHQMHDLVNSVLDFERVLCLDPGCVEAVWSKSLSMLLAGDFVQGWRDYEYRWKKSDARRFGLRLPEDSLWLGRESLDGKTILLSHEQGFGDSLQFCRYIPLLVRCRARVVLCLPKPLVRLFEENFSEVEIVEFGSPIPPYDFHCPLLSLPLAFETHLGNIPSSQGPYLRPVEDSRLHWAQRLAGSGRPKVGIVWSGGIDLGNHQLTDINERRNVALGLFAECLDVPDIDFYSLQKGDPAESEIRGRESYFWREGRLKNFTAELTDFADTAGLIANLDLVISVDTSTAHLSAAMGKPTWILNRFDTCWRWLLDRDDSPWYPSVKLYRQGPDREWRPVLSRVAEDLLRFRDVHQGVSR
jgi:tetratricopeptide (TPR) repeat protein